MEKGLKFYIQFLWLLILVGVIHTDRLPAQTANDSLHVAGAQLQQAFDVFDQVNDSTFSDDGFSLEDGLPQYETADTLILFDEEELAARYAKQIVEEERFDSYFQNFNPVPAKAVWFAALFPGGGQIYNRKYWKLPIVYGGFVGCAYAMRWNNQMYSDYSQAYLDIMDDDDFYGSDGYNDDELDMEGFSEVDMSEIDI